MIYAVLDVNVDAECGDCFEKCEKIQLVRFPNGGTRGWMCGKCLGRRIYAWLRANGKITDPKTAVPK